jgi:large subunit ribosomal protein L23
VSIELDPRRVLIRPLVTEKSLQTSERRNAYTFQVHPKANKIQIRGAVEALFDVTVVGVRTDVRRGKTRMRRFRPVETPDWKRAVVTLKQGDTIDLY